MYYLVVFMFQQTRQGLHACLKGRVLWLHLTTEARNYCHGRVQCVFVHKMTAVPNEAQHTVQSTRFKYSSRFPCADQLQNLMTRQYMI